MYAATAPTANNKGALPMIFITSEIPSYCPECGHQQTHSDATQQAIQAYESQQCPICETQWQLANDETIIEAAAVDGDLEQCV